jgi:LuxR family transcriptional regulator, maltose regulon positive regulatory protein
MGEIPLKKSRTGAGLEILDKDSAWRLCLLVAPAGAGKTKALRHWTRQHHIHGDLSVAWISLRLEHNLPWRFFNDLSACLDILNKEKYGLLRTDSSPKNWMEVEGEMIQVINNLMGSPAPITLIMDNYERIQNEGIHQAVKLFIEYLPPEIRVIIATRSEPPLQQARLRARRQLLELGPAHLGKPAAS